MRNKEENLIYMREWRAKNRESLKAYKKAYFQKNKDRQKALRDSKKHKPAVYLIVKENYVGVTENVKKRLSEHKSKGKDVSEARVLAKFDTRAEALELEEFLHDLGYNGRHSKNHYR